MKYLTRFPPMPVPQNEWRPWHNANAAPFHTEQHLAEAQDSEPQQAKLVMSSERAGIAFSNLQQMLELCSASERERLTGLFLGGRI
jgi:hypothetical protein